MKIIYIQNENDYDALDFEQNHKVTLELWQEIKDGKDIGLNAKAMEFGDVDPAFIRFVNNNMIDYDQAKHTNFYVVPE